MRLIPLFLLLFLAVPLVTATITFDQTQSTLYNYGDKLLISGSVTRSEASRSYLTLSLKCAESTSLSTKIIDLDNETSTSFSQLLLVPQGQTGSCTIHATLNDASGTLLEEADSNDFVITSELRTTFEPLQSTYQLGDKLDIKAGVTKYNNVGADGTATITFTKGDQPISMDLTSIRQGTLLFSKDLSLFPPGNYTLTVEVKDNEGNSRVIPAATFYLEGNLDISAKAEKQIYKPKETFVLSGKISTKSTTPLNNVKLTLSLDEKESQKSKTNDYYTFSYFIPGNIKTGSHTYRINAKDEQGNIGETTNTFTIQAIPTILKLTLNESAFIPSQRITFTTILLDQANDPIAETASLTLFNADNAQTTSTFVQTNTAQTLDVPLSAAPGTWKLVLEGFGLKDEKMITLREHKKLDVNLEANELLVTNNGNVKYKEYFSINSQEKQTGKNLNLDVGESARIKLKSYFDPGTYTITIPSTAQTFENVNIPDEPGVFSGLSDVTGNFLGGSGSAGRTTALILGFLALVVALIFILKPRNKTVVKENIVIQPRMKKRQQEETVMYPNAAPKEHKQQYGIADEKDIEDFRKRMGKMIQDEGQKTPHGGSSQNTGGNVFDIFK
ncbi:MAG: hypothetical protein WC595_05300 [Candidatus Nanoarchaeia archaeon]